MPLENSFQMSGCDVPQIHMVSSSLATASSFRPTQTATELIPPACASKVANKLPGRCVPKLDHSVGASRQHAQSTGQTATDLISSVCASTLRISAPDVAFHSFTLRS